MRILLDTNVFLWILMDDKRLSETASALYSDEGNQVYLSVASLWEIFIKIGTGKLTISAKDPAGFLRLQINENAIDILAITFEHTAKLMDLPQLHKDPFDRLIIAQALHEKLSVLSSDAIFTDYGIRNLF